MSGSVPRSNIHVVIDIIGVMPDPAEMNRYLSAGKSVWVNQPAGPVAFNWVPGTRWSSIQRVPMLSACALTVTEMDRGREGDDEIV